MTSRAFRQQKSTMKESIGTWRRKCVPSVGRRRRRCHHSRFSGSVMLLRSPRARDLARRGGALVGSSRKGVGMRIVEPILRQRRSAASTLRPPTPNPSPQGGGEVRDATRSPTYFGRFFTSLSHFESRRRRSSDEPYLAKSKLMSLSSSSLGACGGI